MDWGCGNWSQYFAMKILAVFIKSNFEDKYHFSCYILYPLENNMLGTPYSEQWTGSGFGGIWGKGSAFPTFGAYFVSDWSTFAAQMPRLLGPGAATPLWKVKIQSAEQPISKDQRLTK